MGERDYTEHLVTARKWHRCDHDRHLIKPGTRYVRCVAFPGHDANTGTRPWVLRICEACDPDRVQRLAAVS